MKIIKEMTDAVIDLAIDGMYSEIEEWEEETGHESEITLSPKPELYEELNLYFTDIMKNISWLWCLKTSLIKWGRKLLGGERE